MSVDSPARPAIPDPAPWRAEPAHGPRDRMGSRLALRNWRVPWRLIALIAIPTVVAMAFLNAAAVRGYLAAQESSTA